MENTMKINMDTFINDLKGNPMPDSGNPESGGLTLGSVCAQGLIAFEETDKDGQVKLKKYELAMKVNKGGEVALTAEEISLIKGQVGKFFTVLVVGQAFKLLEGEDGE
jgi:hypothetical protein